MASKETLIIDIQDDNDNTTEGTLHYTAFNSADRLTRAVTILVICWALAIVTAFIPIAHFVLVPAFLLAGPIMAFLRYRQADAKETVEGECPRHNGPFTIKLEATDKLPKWTYCPECNGGIQFIEKNS